MSFLTKLGIFLAKGIAIFSGLEPLLAPYLGAKANAGVITAINDLTAVGQIVVQAEAILQGPGRGADKLAAAAPLVVNIIKTSELVSHKHIANETLFLQGCTDLTNAVAEILNALSSDSVQSSGKAIGDTPAATTATVPPSLVAPV